jgi:hypothetical protein
MSLENDMFEGTLDELEGIYKKVEGMKKNLLEVPLQQFELLFVKDNKGVFTYESLDKKSTQELVDTLKKDIIPLFEESNYQPGLKKANSYIKHFQEHLDKQK